MGSRSLHPSPHHPIVPFLAFVFAFLVVIPEGDLLLSLFLLLPFWMSSRMGNLLSQFSFGCKIDQNNDHLHRHLQPRQAPRLRSSDIAAHRPGPTPRHKRNPRPTRRRTHLRRQRSPQSHLLLQPRPWRDRHRRRLRPRSRRPQRSTRSPFRPLRRRQSLPRLHLRNNRPAQQPLPPRSSQQGPHSRSDRPLPLRPRRRLATERSSPSATAPSKAKFSPHRAAPEASATILSSI